MKNTITYFLLCIFLSLTVYAKNEQKPAPATHSPIQFMQNKGQVTDQHGAVRRDIDAKVEANGVTMFVGDGEMHYQWTKSRESEVVSRESDAGMPHPASPKGEEVSPGVFPFRGDRGADSRRTNSEMEIYRMDVKLLGANKNAEVLFEEPTGYYEHYYTAHTGEQGVQAKGYGRIIYKDIYPNIDLVLYVSNASAPPPARTSPPPPAGDMHKVSSPLGEIEGQNPSGIKYDFIVHPGGNPADIRLRYEGATEVKLVDGSLVATTPYGSITEAAPYSYELVSDKEVASAYILSGNELSFSTGAYEGTLIIDPVLSWSTFYGGAGYEGLPSQSGAGFDNTGSAGTDTAGNVYLGFITNSSSNIATTGAHQSSYAGNDDWAIVKFNDRGQRIWATYYGGSGIEMYCDVAVNVQGDVYFAGETSGASGMATAGAHQTVYGGGNRDILLLMLDSNGSRQWGTYYGDTSSNQLRALQCDNAGNIWLAGYSGGIFNTNKNYTTSNAFLTTYNQYHIASFNRSGTRIYGSYFYDRVLTIWFDRQDNYYLAGFAFANPNIVTTGSHQATHGGGIDGYINKFNKNHNRLWGTYYGGTEFDRIFDGVCDADGNVYVIGETGSTSTIATNGAYQTGFSPIGSGYKIGFIASLTPGGVRRWGTYYGGNSSINYGWSIAAGADGDIYSLFTGGFFFGSNLTTPGAYETSGLLMLLVQWDKLGNRKYASFYEGNGAYHPPARNCLATNNRGRIYMVGNANTNGGLSTPGAHQTSHSGGIDVYLLQLRADTSVFIREPFWDTTYCPGDTIHLPYDVSQRFRSSNSFTVQMSSANGSFASPVTLATVNSDTAGMIHCPIPTTTAPGGGYKLRIIATAPVDTSEHNLWDIRIKAAPANLSNSSNSPVCTGDTLHLAGSSTSTGITWAWTGPNSFSASAKDTFIANTQLADSGKYILKATLNSTGCSLRDTTTVVMKPTPAKPTAGSNSPVCETLPLTLTTGSSTNGVSYTWAGPGSYSSSTQNPTVTTSASSTHAGDYISTATLNGCSSRDTTTVVVLPKPAKPTAAATNSPLCQRQDLQLTASNITGASYAWYGPSAFTANTQNPVRANVQMADAGAYYVYATVSGCVSDTDSVVVTINTDPVVNIFPTPGVSICQGKQVIFTAIPTNGGSTSYNWLVNGISTGSTGTAYSTTTLNNGDIVSCAMTSTGTCATPFIDTSNTITMTVQPILSPTVTMTADNMPPWNGGLTVTFTANPTHGGSAPEYQWKRNGVDVSGATGPTWGVVVNALNPNEDICVVLKSSYECAVPDTALSNCITTAFTGVGDIVNNKNIKIYPNPVSGILHIEGVEAGSTIELIDVLGRKCAISQLLNGSVDVSMLVPGVYVVRVDGVVVGRVVKN